MRSARSTFWIYLILTLCSCQLNTNNNFSSSLGWIELQSPSGWLLTVYEDGSGCLKCRSAWQCRVCFATGTLSFADFYEGASTRSKNEMGGFHLSMVHKTDLATQFRPIADTLWAASWFEVAYTHVLLLEDPPQAQRRLRKHWQHSPPTGVVYTSAW